MYSVPAIIAPNKIQKRCTGNHGFLKHNWTYPMVASIVALNASYTKRWTILDLPTPDSWKIVYRMFLSGKLLNTAEKQTQQNAFNDKWHLHMPRLYKENCQDVIFTIKTFSWMSTVTCIYLLYFTWCLSTTVIYIVKHFRAMYKWSFCYIQLSVTIISTIT